MISEDKLKAIIEDVMGSLNAATPSGAGGGSTPAEPRAGEISDDALEDLAAVDLKKELLVPDPNNREMYPKMWIGRV